MDAEGDITGSKLFANLYEHAPLGYFLLDMQGRILAVNRAGADLLGTPRPELDGQSLAEYFTPDSRPRFYAHCRQVVTSRAPHTLELTLSTARGAQVDLQLVSNACKSSHPPAVYLRSIAIDITHRKQTETGRQQMLAGLNRKLQEHTSRLAAVSKLLKQETSERSQIEAALAEERNLLRALVDNLPDYIYVKDTQSRFLLVNEATRRHLGAASVEEVVGKTDFDFSPPELAEQYYADEQELFRTGRPLIFHSEPIFDHETETMRWVSTTKVPFYDSRGQIVGLVGMNRDITGLKHTEEMLRTAHDDLEMRVLQRTAELVQANKELQAEINERKQVEQALRESEQRYKQLLDSVTDYIYTVHINTDHTIHTTHGPNCEAVTGYTAQEYHNNPHLWYQMIYEPDRERVIEQTNRLLSGQSVTPLEHRIFHKDGSIRWVRNTPVPRKDRQGTVVSYDGLVSDITERKVAEEALRLSESRYRLLMENASDGIVILDPQGNIRQVNSKISEMLGYSREEVLRLRLEQLIPAEDLAAVPLGFDELKAGKVLLRERTLYHRDGTRVPVEISAKMIEPDKILAILRDITERKAVERREKLAHELGRKLITVLDPDALLKETVSRLKDTFGYYYVHVYLAQEQEAANNGARAETLLVVSEGTGEAGATLKQQGHTIPLNTSKSLVARAARSLEPVVANDVTQNPDHLPNPLLPHTRSEVAIPLYRGRHLIGVLDVQHNRANHFNLNELRTLQIIASELSVALANARLFAEQEHLLQQVQAGRERLQLLSHRLVEVQEAERRHIARELHDEVGQLLTGLKLTLEMSSHQPGNKRPAHLNEARELVNQLIAQVRELSLELRPAMLDDLGLLPTLQWHFERYTAQTQIQVNFTHSGLEHRFAPTTETAAYRIIQEALTNVARYAGVNRVWVHVSAGEQILTVQIEDHGRGFNPEIALSAATSSGLSGMCERAALLNGDLAIHAKPGEGVRLVAQLPLTGPPHNENNAPNL